MARKIQDADVKGSSEVTTDANLINDTKIYVTANALNKRLDEAITAGDLSGGGGGSAPSICYIKDVKSSGVDGGTFTSGSYQTRTLNTTEGDTALVSLSSNQFTLAAGTYEIEADAPAYQVSSHKAILYNVTDSTVELIGTTEMAGTADEVTSRSRVVGRVTIAGSKAFEIRHRCDT